MPWRLGSRYPLLACRKGGQKRSQREIKGKSKGKPQGTHAFYWDSRIQNRPHETTGLVNRTCKTGMMYLLVGWWACFSSKRSNKVTGKQPGGLEKSLESKSRERVLGIEPIDPLGSPGIVHRVIPSFPESQQGQYSASGGYPSYGGPLHTGCFGPRFLSTRMPFSIPSLNC